MRPADRSLRSLPVLEPRRAALETCSFCPKLCRDACPVSNAEPRETLTPWGKVSTAWLTARGDAAADASHAITAWACTDCLACRNVCEHDNPAHEVLVDARDAFMRAGLAPEGAKRVVARFAAHVARTRDAASRWSARPEVNAHSRTALLLGCGYLRAAVPETADALQVACALAEEPVALADTCCGLPLRLAGDRRAFESYAAERGRALMRFERILVLDAGCAAAITRRYVEDAGVDLGSRVVLVVEAAARDLSKFTPVSPPPGGPIRWHDPCQLGRVLGVFEAPRIVLERILGRAPDELRDARGGAVCSGAGGLLPSTLPAISRSIADERMALHAEAGGGRIVTACASSLRALRRRARRSSTPVDDIVTWMARSVGRPTPT